MDQVVPTTTEALVLFFKFFARLIGSYRPGCPKTIDDLLDTHRRICAQVSLRKITLAGEDKKPNPLTVDDRANTPHEDDENYRLEPTCFAIFIVMDTIPSLNACHHRNLSDRDFISILTVILVRTGEHHDVETGPMDFASIHAVSEEVDGNPDVRRLALVNAVDFILASERQNSIIR